MAMTRSERIQFVKALRQFERAANKPQGFGDNIIRAATDWETILRKFQHELGERTLGFFRQRAKSALDKALAA